MIPANFRALLVCHQIEIYEGGSRSFRADIQKPRQMENAAMDI
jgi:hypothetical protein